MTDPSRWVSEEFDDEQHAVGRRSFLTMSGVNGVCMHTKFASDAGKQTVRKYVVTYKKVAADIAAIEQDAPAESVSEEVARERGLS